MQECVGLAKQHVLNWLIPNGLPRLMSYLLCVNGRCYIFRVVPCFYLIWENVDFALMGWRAVLDHFSSCSGTSPSQFKTA